MLNWIVWNGSICIKIDLVLNKQSLVCHKTQPTNHLQKELENYEYNQWLNEISKVINKTCMRIYGVKEKNNEPSVKNNRRQRMM